jgi:hypothetical protein
MWMYFVGIIYTLNFAILTVNEIYRRNRRSIRESGGSKNITLNMEVSCDYICAKILKQLQHRTQLNPCKVKLNITTQTPKTWRWEQYHDQSALPVSYQTLTATLRRGTNRAEWSPPDWSTSTQPSPVGPAAPQQRTAQGSTRRLILVNQPTTESAGCVCTSWRGDARLHCSAETVARPVRKLHFVEPKGWSQNHSMYCTFSQASYSKNHTNTDLPFMNRSHRFHNQTFV